MKFRKIYNNLLYKKKYINQKIWQHIDNQTKYGINMCFVNLRSYKNMNPSHDMDR